MKQKLAIVLRALFESVKYSVEAFSLPTGKHLLPSLLFGVIILIVSIICALFKLPCVIEWPGALLGCLVLVTILIIERSERREVSAFYRAAANRVQSVIQGAKELSSRRATQDGPTLTVAGDSGSSADGEYEPESAVRFDAEPETSERDIDGDM